MRCDGKVGVVTGTSRGLGREILLSLCAEGASVVALSRNAETGAAGVEEAAAAGGRAVFQPGDVREEADIVAAIDRCRSEFGGLDFIVNNAGILGEGRLHETSNELWDDLVATHLTGTFWGCKRALPDLLRAGRGRIVNIASVAGLVGSGGGPAYTAAKHGVVGLTRQLAITYAARGVTINAIGPGAIQTRLRANSARILGDDAPPMTGGVGGSEDAIRAVTPAGRRGTLGEVAAAAVYLVSEDAAYVTGQTLVIDGGWTAA